MNQGAKARVDILILVIMLIVSVFLSVALKLNFLFTSLLLYGLPSIWFSCKNQKMIKKSLLFSFALIVPFFITFNYLGTIGKAWYVPSTVFSFRFFGLYPLEDFIWGILVTYALVMCYEHFIGNKNPKINPKIKYLNYIGISLILLFFILLIFNPELLIIKYIYAWAGLISVLLPASLFFIYHSKESQKFLPISIYFSLVFFVSEMLGVTLKHWVFPGDYIGWVSFFGISFPFEELFFFIIVFPLAVLSYYKFFADNLK